MCTCTGWFVSYMQALDAVGSRCFIPAFFSIEFISTRDLSVAAVIGL